MKTYREIENTYLRRFVFLLLLPLGIILAYLVVLGNGSCIIFDELIDAFQKQWPKRSY